MISLPWPPKELSPNASCKLKDKMRAQKQYRDTCWALTLQAKPVVTSKRPILLTITFFPPDRRGRDLDNMIGSFKRGQDGLALAIRVDDRHFFPAYRIGEPVLGGKVLIELDAS